VPMMGGFLFEGQFQTSKVDALILTTSASALLRINLAPGNRKDTALSVVSVGNVRDLLHF